MPRASLVAGLVLLPVITAAQPSTGLYINLAGGTNFADDLTAANQTTTISTNPGTLGLAGIGWGFNDGLRIELEGSYRATSLGNIFTRRGNGESIPLINPAGSLRAYAIMANLAYDIPLRPFGFPLRPSVGFGLGYSWLAFPNAEGRGYGTFPLTDGNSYTGPTTVTFGTTGSFAYQAMIGASMPLSIVPGLEATLEYRFFGTARGDTPVNRTAANQTNTINGAVPSASTHNGFELHDNSMLIGLRYRFWGY